MFSIASSKHLQMLTCKSRRINVKIFYKVVVLQNIAVDMCHFLLGSNNM